MRQQDLNQASPVQVFYTWHCIAGHDSSVIASLQIHKRTESANPSQAYASTMSWRTTIIQVKWPKENGPPTINIFLLLELTRKSTGRRCLFNYSISSTVNLSGWYYFGNEWSTRMRNDVSDWFSCRQRTLCEITHRPGVAWSQAARSLQHEHGRIPGRDFVIFSSPSIQGTFVPPCIYIFLATTIANGKGRSKKKKKVGTPRVVSGRRRPHASYAPEFNRLFRAEVCP